jgi:hypothetical protein
MPMLWLFFETLDGIHYAAGRYCQITEFELGIENN